MTDGEGRQEAHEKTAHSLREGNLDGGSLRMDRAYGWLYRGQRGKDRKESVGNLQRGHLALRKAFRMAETRQSRCARAPHTSKCLLGRRPVKESPRCGWGLLKLKPPRRGQCHHLLLSPSHQVSTQDKNRQRAGLQESWDEKAKQIRQPHVLLSSCLLLPFRVLLPTGEGHGHPV